MAVEEHLLGLVEVDAVEAPPARREPHDEHPGIDQRAVQEEAHLAEVDLGLVAQQVRLGDAHVGKRHGARLLARPHVAAHGRLAHLGVVLFDQPLEDPPGRVPLLLGHQLVAG